MSSTSVLYLSSDQSQGEPDTESSILVSKVPVTQKSPLYSTTSSSKKVTIWPLGTTVHRLPVYELEKQLKKMKPTQITTICLDLAAQLRTLETQLEKFKKPRSISISSYILIFWLFSLCGIKGDPIHPKIFENMAHPN